MANKKPIQQSPLIVKDLQVWYTIFVVTTSVVHTHKVEQCPASTAKTIISMGYYSGYL